MQPADIALCAAVLVVAFLYSSVGHAGASGYIAVMALASVASPVIRPTALVLNIIVATIGSVQFWRAGHLRWPLFWPFALLSIPAAYFGGTLSLPTRTLNIMIGLVLLASALRLLISLKPATETHAPAKLVAIVTGGVLGFLAGLTGTGGGIFLTPLMIQLRWSSTKQAAATSVVYILVNSTAGLLGAVHHGITLPPFLWPMTGAVIVGGGLGSYLGSQRFSVSAIHVLLASVLILAGGKLILTQPQASKPAKTAREAVPETWQGNRFTEGCVTTMRHTFVPLRKTQTWRPERAHSRCCRA